MKQKSRILILVAFVTLSFAVRSVSGQTPPQQQPGPLPQQQGNFGNDPIRQLNLTPEQREQIRAIREGNREERAAINQRVREANRLLEEGLDADTPDEALIDQRVRDLVTAQAAAIRMRILTEVRIRKVLTAEQLVTLRSLRMQARRTERERRRDERQEQRRQILTNNPALQNRRNDVEQLMRRRAIQRRQRP